MLRFGKPKKKCSNINHNESVEGETIEMKFRRIIDNKEPIKDGAPLIYTDRKDGVQAGYNIRTDRFDVAIEAMEKVNKTKQARRMDKYEQANKAKIIDINGGAEPIHAS